MRWEYCCNIDLPYARYSVLFTLCVVSMAFCCCCCCYSAVVWWQIVTETQFSTSCFCMCFVGCKIWKWQQAGFLVWAFSTPWHYDFIAQCLPWYWAPPFHNIYELRFLAQERRWMPGFIDGVWKVLGHCGNSFCLIPYFPCRVIDLVAVFYKDYLIFVSLLHQTPSFETT